MFCVFISVPYNIKALKAISQPQFFEQIDIQKALTSSTRILYPKIARKSRLDDLLGRRVQLKIIEERKFDQNLFMPIKDENVKEEDQSVDIENDDNDNSLMTENATSASKEIKSEKTLDLNKEIQTLRQQYTETVQLAKSYKCYTKGCNVNTAALIQGSSVTNNCYSPLCIRKSNLRKDLLHLLSKVQNLNAVKDPSKAQSQLLSTSEIKNEVFKDLTAAIASAQNYDEKHLNGIVKFSEKFKVELDSEQKCEINMELKDVHNDTFENFVSVKSENILEESVIPAIGNEMELDQSVSSENEIDLVGMTENEKVVDNSESVKRSKRERRLRDVSIVKQVDDNINVDSDRPPIPKLRISTRGKQSKLHVNSEETKPYKPTYRAAYNRRFFLGKLFMKKDERKVKTELAPDGSIRVYSSSTTMGKIYLKKIASLDKKKKRTTVKYPLCSTFHTKSKAKSIMVLPAHELSKLARNGGRLQANGFNHNSKPNTCVWPYPCARPTFKTCWLYRTVNLASLSAVSIQMRIIWACVRWEDMATKPTNNDGKHQITTETEIISLEMLKHRNVGQFLDKTQYLRRKVIIPLEVPKTIREVTSIRSGLRKRKRAESPQSMEPQVTEEWVDEDKLELWEIKQYGERVERAVPITRTSTGKLPLSRNDQKDVAIVTTTTKVSAQEIKEKMEQQLRMQRAAHQQKRAQEMSQGNYLLKLLILV